MEQTENQLNVHQGLVMGAGAKAPGWHRRDGRGLIIFIQSQEREYFRVLAKPPGERWEEVF